MVSFTAAASALALLASSSLSSAETVRANRRLSFEKIAGYEPLSPVTDHNAVDLDQEAMEGQLALANDESYAAALAVYQDGAFSKSVAVVTLNAPLAVDVSKGTPIIGVSADGTVVQGKAYEDNAAGATEILIQYKTTDSQKNYVGCQVGANPEPNIEGCFAPSGSMTVELDGGAATVTYTYTPLENNINKRSLAGFSTGAQKKMYECATCPYATYEKYYDYYGEYDYANQIVLAAFEGSKTNFKNFNNDFGLYGFDGREQVIKKATAYMNAHMYVIRELEDALDDCKEACTIDDCNDDPVHAWDEAVAFYTGSLEGTDGSGSGKLSYALADKRCGNFKTCGADGDSTSGSSNVNVELFKNFGSGVQKLNKGECASAKTEKEEIERLMRIPLLQGTLRYAWKTDNEPYSEKAEAEGTIFALAILPVVAACDSDAAKVVADNLTVGQKGSCDFPAVKAALESTYECMGISSSDVGGLWDSATGEYYVDAGPMSSAKSVSMAFGAGVAALTALTMFL